MYHENRWVEPGKIHPDGCNVAKRRHLAEETLRRERSRRNTVRSPHLEHQRQRIHLGGVAKLEQQRPFKPTIEGSSPSAPTISPNFSPASLDLNGGRGSRYLRLVIALHLGIAVYKHDTSVSSMAINSRCEDLPRSWLINSNRHRWVENRYPCPPGGMVDAGGLNPPDFGHVGSTPTGGTNA